MTGWMSGAAAPDIHPVIAMADGGAGTSVDRVEFIQMRRCLDRAGSIDQNDLDIIASTFHKGAQDHASYTAV